MKEKIVDRILKLFEVLGLFCTSYGAIITYFFTRKEG